MVINGPQVVEITPFKGTKYNSAAYPIAGPPPVEDTGIGMETADRYGVVIVLFNREERFFLDEIDNQGGWVNSSVGVIAAVTDLSAAL